jgi:hypothetical protein
MLELKKNAMPAPTIKRSRTSWKGSDASPQNSAAVEDTAIPVMAEVLGPNFRANIPAGI